ncbi:MAG: hypothetical protein ACI9TH_004989 [Kiritimatiellia bacterium]|jgi:hypothetical protein
MITSLQIENMTREEKLQVMEAIWADLSKQDEAVESPAWHEQVLATTAARPAAGEEAVIPWEVAKDHLRKRFE